MIQCKTLQVNLLIIIFGVTDHLDLGGHLQKRLREEVPKEHIEATVLSLYKATMTVRAKLRDYWQRVVVITGPGYAQLPLALRKLLASMSLNYRATEFAIMGDSAVVDENGRPTRMDTARVFAELSKTLVGMPLLEGAELTINDAGLREHSEYMKLVQPVSDNGVKTPPSSAIMHMVETSMRLRGHYCAKAWL